MPVSIANLRVFEISANILAFYDGRIEGLRLHSHGVVAQL